jgi:hypothetical protein
VGLGHQPALTRRQLRSRLKFIASVLEQPIIKKILTHLVMQARAPPQAATCRQALQAA